MPAQHGHGTHPDGAHGAALRSDPQRRELPCKAGAWGESGKVSHAPSLGRGGGEGGGGVGQG